jgi:DNA mismatch repair protein MSH3
VVVALAHSIQYLAKFDIADALLETKFFSKFTSQNHMLLAANTLTNLEIYRNETDFEVKGSLLWILDHTKTSFGGRLLRSWIGRPLVDRRVLEERVAAVQEILASTSEKLANLRQGLRRLPDLAKGLARIQYGQVRNLSYSAYKVLIEEQCTPQELVTLVTAFNKLANIFKEPFVNPTEVGFKSPILNDVIYSLPLLREPVKEIMDAIILKNASDGDKAKMWMDPEQYPNIIDADMVSRIQLGKV